VFLPILWLSGLFSPLPPFHAEVGRSLALRSIWTSSDGCADLEKFRFRRRAICVAVLAGRHYVTVLFGGLALAPGSRARRSRDAQATARRGGLSAAENEPAHVRASEPMARKRMRWRA